MRDLCTERRRKSISQCDGDIWEKIIGWVHYGKLVMGCIADGMGVNGKDAVLRKHFPDLGQQRYRGLGGKLPAKSLEQLFPIVLPGFNIFD